MCKKLSKNNLLASGIMSEAIDCRRHEADREGHRHQRGAGLHPHLTQEKPMNFETFHDALKWRKIHRKKLETGNKRQRRAARTLTKCRNRHRCGTEGCRVCIRDFRVGWTGEAVKIMLQRPVWTRCCIITKGLLVPYGQLAKFDLHAQIERLRKRIQRSALHGSVVLGGLDVSLNIENNVIVGWQFHPYLIVEGKDDASLEQAVKDTFPTEPTALEPYDFAEITDPLEVITYAYKAQIKRRSGFVGKNGNHRTKDLPLKGADIRELLPFLAKHKVGARLLLAGVRRNGHRLDFTPTKPSSAPGKAMKAAGGAAIAGELDELMERSGKPVGAPKARRAA
jgi:hypothetical protein